MFWVDFHKKDSLKQGLKKREAGFYSLELSLEHLSARTCKDSAGVLSAC